jgi:hypothetical protein
MSHKEGAWSLYFPGLSWSQLTPNREGLPSGSCPSEPPPQTPTPCLDLGSNMGGVIGVHGWSGQTVDIKCSGKYSLIRPKGAEKTSGLE